jgi:lysyl-tRNA synthetase class 2
MVELKKLTGHDNVDEAFKSFKKVARIGDWVGKEQHNRTSGQS